MVRLRRISSTHKNLLTYSAILALMVLAFLLRMIPPLYFYQDSAAPILAADPWYNLRQIELILAHYPQYPWFDPMTSFPQGKMIDWGPLFPLITASFTILTGAATREEILFSASLVPPLFAALVIPLLFLLGKAICNWKAGLVAAAAIAVIPGEYFFRTSFGFVDHHAAEVLFSTLFCLCYIVAVMYAERHEMTWKNPRSVLIAVGLALGAGVAYLLGLLVMPTMILFAFLVGIFTLIQFITGSSHRTSCRSVAMVNGIAFFLVLAIYTIFMIQREGLVLFTYSAAHSVMYALLLIGTAVLFLLSERLGNDRNRFLLSLVGAGCAGIAVLAILLPSVGEIFSSSLSVFFGFSASVYPIEEMQAMDLAGAWASFNVGIIFLAAGIVVLFLIWRKNHNPWHLFTLTWAGLILLSAILHSRYEYYLAVIVALAAGIAAGYFTHTQEETGIRPVQQSRKKGKTAKNIRSQAPSLILLVLVLFGAISLYQDITAPLIFKDTQIPENWADAMDWLSTGTPDPGIPYLGLYSRADWSYPASAYGVLSLWDYGHWITFLGKRIPNSNPFQDNAVGEVGTIAFLMSGNEQDAGRIASLLGTRYVVTDLKMANTKFENIAVWYNSSRKSGYYTRDFLLPSKNGGTYSEFTLIDGPYYSTMIARLHNFDGSCAVPTSAYYLEYREQDRTVPVITRIEYLPYEAARGREAEFTSRGKTDRSVSVLSNSLTAPLSPIPALQHYRLVYESPYTDPKTGLSEVKIFERVKGARIEGTGIIELELVTNRNRTFTYRQESINGTFTVPYSTMQNPYPVKTVGPYRILDSSLTYEVSEDDVEEGRAVMVTGGGT